MKFDTQVTIYKLKGLNLKRFLKELLKNKIEVVKFDKLDYNLFLIGIKRKDEKTFLRLVKVYHYELNEEKLPLLKRFIKFVRTNIALFIVSILALSSLLICSNFVFQIEIYGLDNLTREEVLSVLQNNGYKEGKFKNNYDLDSIEQVLTKNLNLVSFASAVIKGNTLIVNINEKIDNSEYIYDYPPIVSPFNGIVQKIELVSGSILVQEQETVREGEVIIAPYLLLGDKVISTPARARVTLYIEASVVINLEKQVNETEKQKVIEENKKEVYNNLSCYEQEGEFKESVHEVEDENSLTLVITLSGQIIIEN